MTFIIILDNQTRGQSTLELDNGFIAEFPTYEEAKKEAETWKKDQLCGHYAIYAECSEDKHHLI
jgi:hypothetical protein